MQSYSSDNSPEQFTAHLFFNFRFQVIIDLNCAHWNVLHISSYSLEKAFGNCNGFN